MNTKGSAAMVFNEGPFWLPAGEWAEGFDPRDWCPYLPEYGDVVQHRGRRILFHILREADGAFVAWARHIVDGHALPGAPELAELGRQALSYYLAETWVDRPVTQPQAFADLPARTFRVTVVRDADDEMPAFIEIAETTPIH